MPDKKKREKKSSPVASEVEAEETSYPALNRGTAIDPGARGIGSEIHVREVDPYVHRDRWKETEKEPLAKPPDEEFQADV